MGGAAMRIRILAIVLGSALGAPAWAQTPTQFNLLCSGVLHSPTQGELPWFDQIIVDLDHGLFCDGCKAPTAIAKIEPDKITFAVDAAADGPFVFDRATGTLSQPSLNGVASGHCEKAAFSGFPKTAPKRSARPAHP
jgi:hypothetical protein